MNNDKKLWKKCVLPLASSIKDAIVNLDAGGFKIALIVNPLGVLAGTVSDGDIRRGILRGLGADRSIDSIMNESPVVVSPSTSEAAIRKMMYVFKVQQIPIVDEQRRVVGLRTWDEFGGFQERENLLVIMAGGQGMRLRPYTDDCPKPLLKVAGKPIVEHIITRAVEEGFRKFVLATHYLGHMIEQYLGDGSSFGVKISYLREPSPMGTAGALSLLMRPTESFVVTNGDVLTDIRYGGILDFHLNQDASATMAVGIHEWQHPFGVVSTKDGKIVGFEEKPTYTTHINAGVYVLKPSALDFLQQSERCDMPDLFQTLRRKSQPTVAYPLYETWLDIGRPNDLKEARGRRFSSKRRLK